METSEAEQQRPAAVVPARSASRRPRHAGRRARAAAPAVPLGREFGKLWTAAACSGVGDGIALTAAPLAVNQITSDPRLIAGVTISLTLPFVLFGIPAGVLVDRLDRKRAMATIDFIRFTAVALFTLSLLLGSTHLFTLYVCFFVIGTGETYFRNASQAIVPTLVPRDGLMRANGRLIATQDANTQFVGPLTGAALFLVAPWIPFGVDAITFLMSAVLLTKVRISRTTPAEDAGSQSEPRRSQSLLREMSTGALWLWRHRLLRNLSVMAGALNFVVAGALSVLVVYSHKTLGLGDLGYGVLLAAQAVGALLAAPVAPALAHRLGRDYSLVAVAVAHGTACLVLWLFPSWWTAAVAFMIAACGSVTWDVVVVALRQTLIPDQLQGRVNSVYRLVAWGAIPLGAAAAGTVSHAFGPPAVYGFGAALMLSIGLRVLLGARRRWIASELEWVRLRPDL